MIRRTVIGGTVASVVLLSAAAVGVANAGDDSNAARRVVVRHFMDRNPVNVDLDLGAKGFSDGDMQAFTSRIYENGRQVATNAGTSQIVGKTATTITVWVTGAVTFNDGSVTTEGTFTEDLRVGPRPFTLAVTGGTGAYRTARGDVKIEIIRGTNNSRATATFILGG